MEAVERLRAEALQGRVTLLIAGHDRNRTHARVLQRGHSGGERPGSAPLRPGRPAFGAVPRLLFLYETQARHSRAAVPWTAERLRPQPCFRQLRRQLLACDQSQVYRTLDRLEADGAISTRVIAQTGRPDRRVHSLTPEGWAELDAWLASPLEPRLGKDPLLARIFFAARLGHEKVDALLEEAADAIRQELAALEAIEFDVVDLDTVLKAATLRHGLEGGQVRTGVDRTGPARRRRLCGQGRGE